MPCWERMAVVDRKKSVLSVVEFVEKCCSSKLSLEGLFRNRFDCFCFCYGLHDVLAFLLLFRISEMNTQGNSGIYSVLPLFFRTMNDASKQGIVPWSDAPRRKPLLHTLVGCNERHLLRN